MADFPKRFSNRCPTHPGAFLREIVLPALPMPKTEFAKALGISRQALYDLLSEKQPVTSLMAVRLGFVFDQSPASWLNMQTAYDLWHAERQIDRSKMKPLKLAS
jgi:antitoxin HigA-1